MEERIQIHIATLLDETDLPDDALKQAYRFLLRRGSLDKLLALPLSRDGLMQAARVLQWTLPDPPTRTDEPAPTLAARPRRTLLDIFHDGGDLSEAALCILAEDIEARAFNHARSDRPSDEGERSEGP